MLAPGDADIKDGEVNKDKMEAGCFRSLLDNEQNYPRIPSSGKTNTKWSLSLGYLEKVKSQPG